MSKEINVFVEGEVIVLDHFSGIGHYTAEVLRGIDKLLDSDEYKHIKIEIGYPHRLIKRAERYNFKNLKPRRMPFSPRTTNGLKKRGWIPPIDLLYGKKTYVFPHFSSWPTVFKSPQIPIIYDLSFIKFPEHSAEANRIFLEKQTRLSASRASRVITISQNSKNEIADYYEVPEERIDIVTPILDTKKFFPRSKSEVRKIKAKYGIFEDYILFVGNIEPRKNLVSLLKAYQKLPERIQERYALLLVGAKGWNDGEIYKLINTMQSNGLKVLQPTEYVTDADLPLLLSGAGAFAFVSVYEGYGIPPVEAMACGTAVITSNNSSLPEAVEDGALTVDALDVDAISQALEKVLDNPASRQELIERGLARITRLDAEQSARTFLESIISANEESL